MDLISAASGVFAVVVGIVIGRFIQPRRSTPEVTTMCDCKHPLSMHHPKSRECQADVRRRHYNADGGENGYEWVDCPCFKYVGEIPLDLSTFDLGH